MEISSISSKKYSDKFPEIKMGFNKVHFVESNIKKTEKVFYLIFGNLKTQCGLIAGLNEGTLKIPFSAPYSNFSFKKSLKINVIEECLEQLKEFSKSNNVDNIIFTPPPQSHDPIFLSKLFIAFRNKGWQIKYSEINYYFETNKVEKHLALISRSGRKNLKKANSSNLSFEQVTSSEKIKKAYSIIKINRASKNYDLKLSYKEVVNTSNIIKTDFFIVYFKKKPVASAIIFHVTKKIAQVIYWGDLPDYSQYRPINYLSDQLMKYYSNQSIEILDVGPSSVNGIPNYGLCEFKESIGCTMSLRHTFELDVK